MPANVKKPLVQMKVNATSGRGPRGHTPVAPAIYRPQPMPKVLQKKAPPAGGPIQSPVYRPELKTPAAPPIYRIDPIRVAQAKRIAPTPANQRSNGAVVQRAELGLVAGGLVAGGLVVGAAYGIYKHCLRGQPDAVAGPAGPLAAGGLGGPVAGPPVARPPEPPVLDRGGGGDADAGALLPPPQLRHRNNRADHDSAPAPLAIHVSAPAPLPVPALSLSGASSLSLPSSPSLSAIAAAPALVPPPPTLSSGPAVADGPAARAAHRPPPPPSPLDIARVERCHKYLVEGGTYLRHLARGGGPGLDMTRFSPAELQEVRDLVALLSDFGFDWMTNYNTLTYRRVGPNDDMRPLVQQLIDDAQFIRLGEIYGRAVRLYRKATRGGVVAVAVSPLRYMSIAMSEAVREKNRHPQGPSKDMGKTIACLINVDDPTQFWVASSGTTHRLDLTPETRRILVGVYQVEEWPVDACAEVNALDLAIRAHLAPVRNQTHLYSYCFTWNIRTRRWTGRGACHNCKQWLSRYK